MGLPPGDGEADLWQVTERLARDPDEPVVDRRSASTRPGRTPGPCATSSRSSSGNASTPPGPSCRTSGSWPDGSGPASYLAFVKTQTAAITGLADTTMSRDQTWLFFTLGRCLERTDVVARQLPPLSFEDIPDSGLVMLLRSCGGYEPYLRLVPRRGRRLAGCSTSCSATACSPVRPSPR